MGDTPRSFRKVSEKWEGEDLSAEEMAYYIDVQARVSKKLVEVTEE